MPMQVLHKTKCCSIIERYWDSGASDLSTRQAWQR